MLENRYRAQDSSDSTTAKPNKKSTHALAQSKNVVQMSYIDSKKKSLDPQILTTYESFKKDFNFFMSPRTSSDNVLHTKSKEILNAMDQLKKAKALASGSSGSQNLQQPKLSHTGKTELTKDDEEEELELENKNENDKSKERTKNFKYIMSKEVDHCEKIRGIDKIRKEQSVQSKKKISPEKKNSARSPPTSNASHLNTKANTKKSTNNKKSFRQHVGPSNCSLNSASNSSQHSFVKKESYTAPKENNFMSVLEEPCYKKHEDSLIGNSRPRMNYEPFKDIKNIFENKSKEMNDDRRLLVKNDTYKKIKEKIQNSNGNNFHFGKEKDRLSSEHGNRENEDPNLVKSQSNISTMRSQTEEANKTLASIISSNLQKKINEFYSSSTKHASQIHLRADDFFTKATQKEGSLEKKCCNAADAKNRKTSMDFKTSDLQSRAEKYINALNNKNLKINAALHAQIIDPKDSLDDLRERYRILKSGESVYKESGDGVSGVIGSAIVCTSKFSTATSNGNHFDKSYHNKSIGGSSPSLLNNQLSHSSTCNSIIVPNTSSFNSTALVEKQGLSKSKEIRNKGINDKEKKQNLAKSKVVEAKQQRNEIKEEEPGNNFAALLKSYCKTQPLSTKNVSKKHIDFDLASHKRQYSRDYDQNYNNYQIVTNTAAANSKSLVGLQGNKHHLGELEKLKSNKEGKENLDSHRTTSSVEYEDMGQEVLSQILNKTKTILESYKMKESKWNEEKWAMSNQILHLTERLSVYEDV